VRLGVTSYLFLLPAGWREDEFAGSGTDIINEEVKCRILMMGMVM
jgi:hypothetical protein